MQRGRMSGIGSTLKSLFAFIQNHEVSFSNGLLVLFTIGCEHIFRITAFHCPCTHPRAFYYALVFFVAPFIILSVLGESVQKYDLV